MRQKGFVPIVVLLVVAVAAVASFVLYSSKSSKSSLPNNLTFLTGSLEQVTGAKRPYGVTITSKATESLAASVVKTFCESIFKGPPATNESGTVQALGFLSQKATQSVSTKGPGPSAALVSFIGTSDIPEQGFTISEVSEGEEKTTVKTIWKYAKGPQEKVFSLVKENEEWKIDSIK